MNKIRIADFIIDRLYRKYGISVISLLTGNGSLVINDAISQNKNITPICVHHEQDAGYFALGYSKYTNKLSVVNPTTGCSGTNCITPLLAAYQDHTPILFLSGNVALKQTSRHHKLHHNINLKKLGTQELDIIEIVRPLTKYSVMVDDINMVKYHLDKAIDIAMTAPFGPVWIDIPSDICSTIVNEDDLIEYEKPSTNLHEANYILKIDELLKDLNTFQRPLVLTGNGISLSNSRHQFKRFIESYELPVVGTYGGKDLLDYNHPLNIGIIGVKGDRAGNFAIQNCNLLLVLGACLNIPQCGYMGEKFASRAKKIVVDIDVINHSKNIPKIDNIIECELGKFFEYVNK